ncbi:SDR family oxidoreductase [Myxococcus sp. AM009]|uniref:SDR family oxidoreductase n=1 Tax=Myxococcus sp. AM009 TaxID=2745137 RepID=UPI0020CC9C08|nr:SDR family oxidoreductase [Myxococcus sp. AM009]
MSRPTKTPAMARQGLPPEQQDALREQLRGLVRFSRMDTPWELAKAAVFLASDESRFVVGTELLVDGVVANRWRAEPSAGGIQTVGRRSRLHASEQ